MFKFNNTHIFTGYLKQKLSSINIPACKIYTREFADYLATHGQEDPRVVESIDTVFYSKDNQQSPVRVNYLKNNELFNYYTDHGLNLGLNRDGTYWKRASNIFYSSEKSIPGLTKTLYSPGRYYDTTTHEYLGEYLRFLRDYHNINLMSLYNCFNNTIYTNVSTSFEIGNKEIIFDSQDSNYKIYAIPAKLFANYTIALDSNTGIEVFCGLYNNHLDTSGRTNGLFAKTYQKFGKTIFNQPVLYDKLNVANWSYEETYKESNTAPGTHIVNMSTISRWAILNREQDLKIFIKVPTACRSSIVILEGDYRNFNNAAYLPNIDKSLNMTGCGTGSVVNLGGYTTKIPQGHKLETWKFFHYGNGRNSVGIENSNETLEVKGVVLPSIENIESSENLQLWTQGVTTQPKFSEGSGYCEITTAEELAYVIVNGGATKIIDQSGTEKTIRHYKILNDIYLNDPTKINWESGGKTADAPEYVIRTWYQHTENNNMKAFAGTIEGCGHTIYGLYLDNAGDDNSTALIPIIDRKAKTTIRDLGINYAYLRSTNVGAFVSNVTEETTNTGERIKPLDKWTYEQNHTVVNVSSDSANNNKFIPISRLQLLEFNTGESYPFADRLVEYLSGSAITPIDEISDNIKRVQRVMKQNQHYFKIEGLWENKIQRIIYDYMINAGPIKVEDEKLVDKRRGYQPELGHISKSTIYDILGYIDKDAEKWYASWQKLDGKAAIHDTIQNIDIYDGLYDI